MTRRFFLFIAFLFCFAPCLRAAPPDTAPILIPPYEPSRLAAHPRLLATDADISRLKDLIAREPLAKTWRDSLRKDADTIIGDPPVEHILIGPRLLDKSRRALERIYTLALLYRLERDPRDLKRAIQELDAVCAFKDWNPSHFLDVAEMTHAVAIGYDWLYKDLPPATRTACLDALVNLGLKEGEKIYRSAGWWSKAVHNWNQVCNGGMTIGALAVGDDEPVLSDYILRHAVASVPLAMASYSPDGGWAEGPGYWDYATQYNVFMLAALESALHSDFGLLKSPGFADTGIFRIQFNGPINRTFNYADGGDRVGGASGLFWLSRRLNKPLYAWMERDVIKRPSAHDLLWLNMSGSGPAKLNLPLDAWYKGIQVVFMRSAWEDPNALFVGFKGGDNKANHSHLDLGTFVLDADGQRWALDLGSDDYNLPGYFSKQRFTYYRLMTEGHNTITLDGENQDAKAAAPIITYRSGVDKTFAVTDMSAGYRKQATSVMRGIAMLQRRAVLVQDEISAKSPVEIFWTMHTAAKVTLNGDQAHLTIKNSTMNVRILEPKGAKFDTLPANPPAPQKQNPGITRLIVRLPEKTDKARIVVLLTPGSTRKVAEPAIVPLALWK